MKTRGIGDASSRISTLWYGVSVCHAQVSVLWSVSAQCTSAASLVFILISVADVEIKIECHHGVVCVVEISAILCRCSHVISLHCCVCNICEHTVIVDVVIIAVSQSSDVCFVRCWLWSEWYFTAWIWKASSRAARLWWWLWYAGWLWIWFRRRRRWRGIWAAWRWSQWCRYDDLSVCLGLFMSAW